MILLFDVDGTLVDSTQPILQCLNGALDDVGLDRVTSDYLGRMVGPPLRVTVGTLLQERGADAELTERVMDAYRAEYRTVSVDQAASYPGVVDLLEVLNGKSRLGVVTSKPAAYAIPILDALGFSSMMEVIEGPGPSETETKSVTLARALDRLGFEPEVDRVAMVGDRRFDIEAGQSRGVETIGVTWGFGSRRELLDAGADHIVDNPDQIAGIAFSVD